MDLKENSKNTEKGLYLGLKCHALPPKIRQIAIDVVINNSYDNKVYQQQLMCYENNYHIGIKDLFSRDVLNNIKSFWIDIKIYVAKIWLKSDPGMAGMDEPSAWEKYGIIP